MNCFQIRPFLAKKGILGPKKGSKVAQIVRIWNRLPVHGLTKMSSGHKFNAMHNCGLFNSLIGSLANKLSLWFQVKKFELVHVTPYQKIRATMWALFFQKMAACCQAFWQ